MRNNNKDTVESFRSLKTSYLKSFQKDKTQSLTNLPSLIIFSSHRDVRSKLMKNLKREEALDAIDNHKILSEFLLT